MRHLYPASEALVKALPWKTPGARLHLPRDLEVSYAVGRMGVATTYDIWPLFWDSLHTARTGFRRLLRLGLLRVFDREDPSHPAWYALTPEGAAWVAEETDCEESELRIVTGISRTNLHALRVRNRFWTSLVLAARKTAGIRLELFRPEWELRRLKGPSVPIVPDAMIVLADGAPGGGTESAWMVELDAGTERTTVWAAKATAYAQCRHRGSLYGAISWNVLALTPSERRSNSVARAVTEVGAGSFIFVGVGDALQDGRALDTVIWRASSLATSSGRASRESLISCETAISAPNQRGHSTVDRGSPKDSGVLP